MTIPFQNRDYLRLEQHMSAHPNSANKKSLDVMVSRPWEGLEAIPREYNPLGLPAKAAAVGRSNARIFWPSIFHQNRFSNGPPAGSTRQDLFPTVESAHNYVSGSYVSSTVPEQELAGLRVKGYSNLIGDNALNADLTKALLFHTGIDWDPWKPWIPYTGTYGRTVNPIAASTTNPGDPQNQSSRSSTPRRHRPGRFGNSFADIYSVQIPGVSRPVGRPYFPPLPRGFPVAWLPGSRKDESHYIGVAGWTNTLISDFSSGVNSRQEAIFSTRVADLDPDKFGEIDPTKTAPLSTALTVVRQFVDKADKTLSATIPRGATGAITPASVAMVGGLSANSLFAGRGQMTTHGHYANLNDLSGFNTTGPGPGSCETPKAVMYVSETGGGPLSSGDGITDLHTVGTDQFGVPHVGAHIDNRCPVYISPDFDATNKHSGVWKDPFFPPKGFPLEVLYVTDLEDKHRAVGPNFKEQLYPTLHKWQMFIPLFIPDDSDPEPKEDGIPFEPSEETVVRPGSGSPILASPDFDDIPELTTNVEVPDGVPLEQTEEIEAYLIPQEPPKPFGDEVLAEKARKTARDTLCARRVVTEATVANVSQIMHHWLPSAHGTMIFRPEPDGTRFKDVPYQGTPDPDFFKSPLGPAFVPFGEQDTGGPIKASLEGEGYRFALGMANGGITVAPASYSLDSRVKSLGSDCPRFILNILSEATGNCAGKGRLAFGSPTTEGKVRDGMSIRYERDSFSFDGIVFATHNSSGVESDDFRVYEGGDIRLGPAGDSVLLTVTGGANVQQTFQAATGTIALTNQLGEGVTTMTEVTGSGGTTNADANTGYLIDVSSSGQEVSLPEIEVDADDGDVVFVKDRKGDAATNNITVTCNGTDTIEDGGPASETLDTDYDGQWYRATVTKTAGDNYWVRV